MTIFGALATSSSGLTTYRTWMDAVSDNMANLNTVKPTDQAAFQAKFVDRRGRRLRHRRPPRHHRRLARRRHRARQRRTAGSSTSPTTPSPTRTGMVRYPDIDLATQMTSLLMAQRGYQANLAVVERATQAYQAALQLGR